MVPVREVALVFGITVNSKSCPPFWLVTSLLSIQLALSDHVHGALEVTLN
jgi:hypothetical protein